MKSFLRRSKCDKSTLRKIELIVRRGYFRKRRGPETIRGFKQHSVLVEGGQ